MRFCEECGAQLEDSAKFCEECGAQQEPVIIEDVQIQEIVSEAGAEDSISKTTEYGYCEECGARIKLSDAFCEACGTEIHSEEPVTAVAEEQSKAPGVHAFEKKSEEKTSEQARRFASVPKKKGKSVLRIAVFCVAILLVVAGGYLLGRNKQNQKEETITDQFSQSSKPEEVVTDIEPVVASAEITFVPLAKEDGKSIFDGYRKSEYFGYTKTIDSPDGLLLKLEYIGTQSLKPRLYLSRGEYYVECIAFDDMNLSICYPECVLYGEKPVEGNEIRIKGINDMISTYVYWAYHENGKTTVYYDGLIDRRYRDEIYEYGRYLDNSLKDFESAPDGGILREVVYSGDDEAVFSFGLTYNHEQNLTRMELYNYAQDVYLCGYVNKPIYYNQDMVYYLKPVWQDDMVYWDEIPYEIIDENLRIDLSPYDIFCEVKITVTEESISICWSAHENGAEYIYYNDCIEAKKVQRRAYVEKLQ